MAIATDIPVPTYDGWKPAGQLQIGDIVFTPDSRHVEIKRLQVYAPKTMYEITLDDGLTLECDDKTKLQLQNRIQRLNVSRGANLKDRQRKFRIKKEYPFYTAPEIIGKYKRPDNRLEFSLLNSKAIPFPAKDLPVPPYLLAIWLFSRTKTGNMWVGDKPIDKIKKVARGYGHFISTKKGRNTKLMFEIRPSIKDTFLFAGADIPHTIPISYIECSIEQRMEFLEGAIDSKRIWYENKSSSYVLSDRDFHFLKRFQGLLESLGYKTQLLRYKHATSYVLKYKIYDISWKNRRLITKIEEIAPKECIHIETGTQFVVGEGFLPVC